MSPSRRFYTRQIWFHPHLWVDIFLILFSFYFSLWLRVGDGPRFDEFLPVLNRFAAIFLALRIICFWAFGVYRAMWRYISSVDAVNLAKAIGLSSLIFATTSYILRHSLGGLPRSLFFIEAFCACMFLMGARIFRRMLFERQHKRLGHGSPLVRTLIYGAGANGRDLAQRLSNDPKLGLTPIGFIDDDAKKLGRIIGGVTVLGTKNELEEIIQRTAAQQLIVAMPSPHGDLIREIVGATRKYNIQPQIIEQLHTQNINRKKLSIYREVNFSDLLNRKAKTIDLTKAHNLLHGKRVLITGAGGSIGSELARQIYKLEPQHLILCDHSEFNLYDIDKELRLSENGKIIPLLLDIKDKKNLLKAFLTYKPEVVFHAAAYKHVHLVEANPNPAILNNIGGTLNLLEACQQLSVEKFVLISTDKAVNPAGIMGATKRVCELLTTEYANLTGKAYSAVRFGNVLGSSGSLVPLLKKQIEDGGPVTITHEKMTRFFMLIPEAVSLVLLSSTLSKPGDINVLKMGDPIRIVDIARSLISIMGKTEEEIPILFTDPRPGEKMFEELYIRGDELQTEHPDILTVPRGDRTTKPTDINFVKQINELITAAENGNDSAAYQLTQIVNSSYMSPKWAESFV